MSVTVTKKATDGLFALYLASFDGNPQPDNVVTNAQLLSDIPPGPLRDLFAVTGLTTQQINDRILNSGLVLIAAVPITNAAPVSPFVEADTNGAPRLGIAFLSTGGATDALVSLSYRHTSIRGILGNSE